MLVIVIMHTLVVTLVGDISSFFTGAARIWLECQEPTALIGALPDPPPPAHLLFCAKLRAGSCWVLASWCQPTNINSVTNNISALSAANSRHGHFNSVCT